ncbi:MAG TPA: hypothetical protein DCF33_09395 [Saprospirales bacterium]|nr:hypothetical protein [Saprospirales bacterium]
MYSLQQSLETLENHISPAPEDSSYLVQTCHSLRKKPLADFEVEDLRIMIGQNIGLKWLMPLAIQVLQQNILAEGHFYRGDLLQAVLTSEKSYWQGEPVKWNSICTLFRQQQALLDAADTNRGIKRAWFDAFASFEKYHA